ncbi:DUF547 domain-containing protein [Aquimarina macrocephali]|uniref:DUF547 domain-containing protein n=1 Tax=Aquimarina macrocephali TaxID=666563 RepID=UPI000463BF7A|nr:DUF547 domain-containing protein [Aquimarina macrocephali]
MKNLFFIVLICFFVACGGSKKAIQNTTPGEHTTAEEKINSPKIIVPVEEKAPDTAIEKVEPEEEEEEVEEAAQQQKETTTIKEDPKVNIVKAFNHQPWNDLLQKHVSANGIVNYIGFKQDHLALKSYLAALRKNIPTKSWSKSDTLAYWMNVYNAFTIKLILDNYPLKSIKDIKNPWDLRFFKLGNKWYTLNDVEHRILRKMGDPRIHFGINCASISCPRLLNKAFTAQNVDRELEKLTIDFINDTKQNTITSNSVQLSKIFTWFAKDFKTEGSLIHFLNKYSKITINTNAKKSFKKYNWSLNE